MLGAETIDKYLDESALKMNSATKRDTRNMLLNFFGQKPSIDFSDLTKDDLIEMYSGLSLMSINSFLTIKSKITDFARWMFEHGDCSKEALTLFSDIQYFDIDRLAFYSTYYFRDITDLYSTLEEVFSERGSEFDTFKAASILVWNGIDIKLTPEILKSDLDVKNRTIIHPATKEKICLESDPIATIYFLEQYRDAESYDTKKFGGGILPYAKSEYLLRSYKNAHFTPSQISNISSSANRVAKEFGKIFQWNRIYLSGLYYRINQYEQDKHEIGEDIDMLKKFFELDKELTPMRKLTLIRKYTEYQEFKKAVYS